jgi:glycerophosphoryl diester phosphodiesterase
MTPVKSSGWREDHNATQLPQTIAHRGYKAAFPENTLGAFRGAVDVGAHALETDLHLSKDGVVVISHVSAHSGSPAAEFGTDELVAKKRTGCDVEEVFRQK